MSEIGTVMVEMRVATEYVTKAFSEAAAAINNLMEAYLSLLPWYRRWPLRVRIWIHHRTYRWGLIAQARQAAFQRSYRQ
jgi:hypothetical protein